MRRTCSLGMRNHPSLFFRRIGLAYVLSNPELEQFLFTKTRPEKVSCIIHEAKRKPISSLIDFGAASLARRRFWYSPTVFSFTSTTILITEQTFDMAKGAFGKYCRPRITELVAL